MSGNRFKPNQTYTIGAGIVVTVGLILLAGFVRSDVTRVAVPGILTGVGTLALAGLTFGLLRREDDDRRATEAALEHSRQLVLEAALQRRDSRARSITVTAVGPIVVFRPSFGGPPDLALTSGTLVAHIESYPDEVGVRQQFRVAALDGNSITIMVNGLTPSTMDRDELHGNEITLPAGGAQFNFDTVRSFVGWDAIIEQREHGDPGDEGRGEIAVSDIFDDGVIDSYVFAQGGTPLVRQSNVGNTWYVDLSTDPCSRVAAQVYPLHRQYWISKRENKQLMR